MHKYFIEQKIKTLSHLAVGLDQDFTPKMNIDNYIFHQEFDVREAWKGNAWFVKKEIKANSGVQALNQFRSQLDKIVQKIGFVSQCYMDFYREPFLIYKFESNPEKIFFYKHIQERDPVGLQFDEQELGAYEAIKEFKYPEAFRFLQESRNTIGYIPRLLLLFSALEAMCGKVEYENSNGKVYITYNKDEMKKILGDVLYNEVYGENGIRHKLNHGEMVESAFGRDYSEEIYKSIISYFNMNFNAQIEESVVSPQRNFYDNREFLNLWLKPEESFNINLKSCIDGFNETDVRGCSDVFNIDIQKY